MLLATSGSLSIKKKHRGLSLPWSPLTLYQIPILPHRQRAEEAQRERVPGKKAMKPDDSRSLGAQLWPHRGEMKPIYLHTQGQGEQGRPRSPGHAGSVVIWSRQQEAPAPKPVNQCSQLLTLVTDLSSSQAGVALPPTTLQYLLHFCSSSN